MSTPQGGSVHTFAIDTGNELNSLQNIIPINNFCHYNYFIILESKDIHYLRVTKPFHESVSVIDVCNDVLICYKSSLNKPGQLFVIKIQSVDSVYDFNDISFHEISPSRSLPNSDEFVVEHGYTLYGKI